MRRAALGRPGGVGGLMYNDVLELAKRLEGYDGDRYVIEAVVHDAEKGLWTLTVRNAAEKQTEEEK